MSKRSNSPKKEEIRDELDDELKNEYHYVLVLNQDGILTPILNKELQCNHPDIDIIKEEDFIKRVDKLFNKKQSGTELITASMIYTSQPQIPIPISNTNTKPYIPKLKNN
ncbi:MAG: hypothetical protein AABY22_07005, partial [Nanoarchaeota archaeon]